MFFFRVKVVVVFFGLRSFAPLVVSLLMLAGWLRIGGGDGIYQDRKLNLQTENKRRREQGTRKQPFVTTQNGSVLHFAR